MYEIYINDRPLRLIATSNYQSTRPPDPSTSHLPKDQKTNRPSTSHLLARYTGKVKTLLHYADVLEKGSPKVSAVTIHYPELGKLWSDFQSHYKLVPAAGGVVRLAGTDQFLFIHRRGYLDLPKGKVDPGETIPEAAIREVQEETGVKEIKLVSDLEKFDAAALQIPSKGDFSKTDYRTTLHTYRNRKGKRVLKPTYWFRMETAQKELIPQAEEDIDWARWMTLEKGLGSSDKFYPSLMAIVENMMC